MFGIDPVVAIASSEFDAVTVLVAAAVVAVVVVCIGVFVQYLAIASSNFCLLIGFVSTRFAPACKNALTSSDSALPVTAKMGMLRPRARKI